MVLEQLIGEALNGESQLLLVEDDLQAKIFIKIG